jgi:hypothetical protein
MAILTRHALPCSRWAWLWLYRVKVLEGLSFNDVIGPHGERIALCVRRHGNRSKKPSDWTQNAHAPSERTDDLCTDRPIISRLRAVGIRCADHVTPSTRRSRHYFADSGGRSVGIVRLRTKATEFSFRPIIWRACVISNVAWILNKCSNAVPFLVELWSIELTWNFLLLKYSRGRDVGLATLTVVRTEFPVHIVWCSGLCHRIVWYVRRSILFRSCGRTTLWCYLRSWDLLEKLPVVQPLKNIPTFYGIRRFITVFTRALHWSVSWARAVQSIPYHPILSL